MTTLHEAVHQLAQVTQSFSEADLDRDWTWLYHDEGVRFALIGTYHELRTLAVTLSHIWQTQPRPPAQHALAQFHAAFRELEAILLSANTTLLDTRPALEEWPLRIILGHMLFVNRAFFTQIHYALHRDPSDPRDALPAYSEQLLGSDGDMESLLDNADLAGIMAAFTALHNRILDDLAGLTPAQLAVNTWWWEEADIPVAFRLHRFDAHLRQHTIQAEKTLAQLGYPPSEAHQWLRLVYQALAEVEGWQIGAPHVGVTECQTAASLIAARAQEISRLVTTG